VQNLVRQKEAELKQANAELEERGKLLYKTKVCALQEATCSWQLVQLSTTTCHLLASTKSQQLPTC
jgi:hypothetical protein